MHTTEVAVLQLTDDPYAVVAEISQYERADDEDALAIFKDLAQQDAILIEDGGRPDYVLVFLFPEMGIVPLERHDHKLPSGQYSSNVL